MKKLLLLIAILFFKLMINAQEYKYEWSTGLFDDVLPNGIAIDDIDDPINVITEYAGGVAKDQDGNIITTGHMKGSYFDIATLSTVYKTAGMTLILQKQDPSGAVIWSHFIDGGNYDIPSANRTANDIIVDSENNIYICGRINDTTDFDPGAGEFLVIPQNYWAGYVAKYTSNGELDFVYILQGGTDIEPRYISIDKQDNILVTGIFEATVDFDAGANTNSSASNRGMDDNFLLKINAEGIYQWHKTWGARQPDDPVGLEVDDTGNIYVACQFIGSVDTDPGVAENILTSGAMFSSTNSYLSKFDEGGNLKWSTFFKSSNLSSLYDLATDGDNVCVLGTYKESLEIGQEGNMQNIPIVSPSPDQHVFVIKLNSAGEYLWDYSPQLLQSSLYSYGFELAEHNGNWFAQIGINGVADLDNGQNVDTAQRTTTAQYIVKLSEDGTYQWNQKFEMDAYGFLELHEIITSNQGMYIVGHYSDAALDTDPDPNHSHMQPDWFEYTLFLIKLRDTTAAQEQNHKYDEIQKVVSSDRSENDRFGNAVAISGNYMVVAAHQDDIIDQDMNRVIDAGSAYIFEYDGKEWVETQKITPPDTAIGESYGYALAIEGETIAFAGPLDGDDEQGESWMLYAGSVTMFERNNSGNWIQTQKIVAPDRERVGLFGHAVSISGDYMAISSLGTDLDQSGTDTVLNSGGVYIYERDQQRVWNFHQKIVASDREIDDFFGVSLQLDHDVLVVGAPDEDHDEAGANFMNASGSAYIFKRDGFGNWNEVQKIVAWDRSAGDGFGYDVEVENDFIILGGYQSGKDRNGENIMNGAGAVYVFKKDNQDLWQAHQKLLAPIRESGDGFGFGLALDDKQLIISTNYDHEDEFGSNSKAEAGLIYVFELNTSDKWVEKARLVASDRDEYDRFGYSVAIDKGRIVCSAVDEDHDEFGNDFISSSGSVYFFNEIIDCSSTRDSIIEAACVSYVSPSGNYEWNTSGIYQDTLVNNAGCDSLVTIDLSIQTPVEGVDIKTACDEFTWIDGLTYTESTDTPIFTISGAASNGCDSIVSLDLSINKVNTNVSINGNILTSDAQGALYQWLDCDADMSVIHDETNQIYTANESGSYAVEVYQNGCVDTTDCYAIIRTSLEQNAFTEEAYLISPNPNKGSFSISFNTIQDQLSIRLLSVSGQELESFELKSTNHLQIQLHQPSGMYLIEITDRIGRKSIEKLLIH